MTQRLSVGEKRLIGAYLERAGIEGDDERALHLAVIGDFVVFLRTLEGVELLSKARPAHRPKFKGSSFKG
jgi:hypothetical protein